VTHRPIWNGPALPWHAGLMWHALTFAVLDLTVGGYLLWFARTRQQRRHEPVILVGAFLVLASAFLVYVAWRAAHPTVHKIVVPIDSTLG
jgi:hypothetical protein